MQKRKRNERLTGQRPCRTEINFITIRDGPDRFSAVSDPSGDQSSLLTSGGSICGRVCSLYLGAYQRAQDLEKRFEWTRRFNTTTYQPSYGLFALSHGDLAHAIERLQIPRPAQGWCNGLHIRYVLWDHMSATTPTKSLVTDSSVHLPIQEHQFQGVFRAFWK